MSNYITIAVTPGKLAILRNQQNSTHGATRLVVRTNNGEFRAMTPADVFKSRGSHLVHQVVYNAQPAIHQPSGISIHQPGRIVIHQSSGFITHQQPRYITSTRRLYI